MPFDKPDHEARMKTDGGDKEKTVSQDCSSPLPSPNLIQLQKISDMLEERLTASMKELERINKEIEEDVGGTSNNKRT